MASNLKLNAENKNKPMHEFESADLSTVYDKWQSPLLSTNYELILAHRELQDANEKLKEKKKEKELQNLDMGKKRVELQKKQENFKNFVFQQNEIFIEHENKCVIAEQEMKESNDIQNQFDQETILLRKKLKNLSFIGKKLKMSITQLKPFKDMLEDIVKDMEEFKDIHELVNYYKTLMAAKKNLTDHLNGNIKCIEKLYLRMENFTKDKLKDLLITDDRISQNYINYEDILHSTSKWANMLEASKQTTDKKIQNFETVKFACNSIYTQLLKWKRTESTIKNNDYIGQLMFVQKIILELQQVLIISTKLSRIDEESCRPDSTFISVKRDI